MIRTTTLFVSVAIALAAILNPCAQAQEKTSMKYALVIHGGAGKAPADADWVAHREQTLKRALDEGTSILKEGGASLDAVEAVIRILEDSPYFNAGKGAVFNSTGTHELDASIMDGRTRAAGAVGGVSTVRHPISLARLVMTDTRHILLATGGAEKFADGYDRIERVPNDFFSTEHQRAKLKEAQDLEKQQDDESRMGTVGCVALDTHGNIAAGTSTGGLTNKKYGRIGDSPIVCAGTFADNAACGVSCTGIGEDFMRNAVAYDVSARMEYRGDSLERSVHDVLHHKSRQVRGGIIALDREGHVTMQFNTGGMARAASDSSGRFEVHVAD